MALISVMEEEFNRDDFVTPFGKVLGIFQGVEGRSNGSDNYFSGQQNWVDGTMTGIKYQCVEYARRWLLSKDLDFHSVPFAAHIWKIKYLERVSDGKATFLKAISNGSPSPPIPESILIWKVAPDVPFGHIAVITEVNLDIGYIRIAEQNVDNNYWPGNYARELKLEVEDGKYFIRDEDEIYGWMLVTFDIDRLDQNAFSSLNHPIKRLEVDNSGNNWLNLEDPIDAKFSQVWGHHYSGKIPFYTIEAFLSYKITFATMEAGFLSVRATNTIIGSDELLTKLNVPQWSWERLRKSWYDYWESTGKIITSRIEFGIRGRSLKILNIYADSCLGLCESAYFDEKLGQRYGNEFDKSNSEKIYTAFKEQCKEAILEFVHIFIEEGNDIHEYSALFVQKALKENGQDCKIVRGLGFRKDSEGKFEDLDGVKIVCVWKFIEWHKVFKDYERARVDDNELKISDLLLNSDIKVFEPLWKAVTANRGLLPVLHQLFPNHQYVLDADWELCERLASKPHKARTIGSGPEDEGTGTFYVEDFECEKIEGVPLKVNAFSLSRRLSAFSFVENDSGLPFACSKVINDD